MVGQAVQRFPALHFHQITDRHPDPMQKDSDIPYSNENIRLPITYKVTDFYHPGDEGGLAWNDPAIGIEWPELCGEYKGTASAEGYTLKDGTPLNLSDKDQKWLNIEETFKF